MTIYADKAARALLRAIGNHLLDVDFFTREDLLQLPVFDHVSTITRYAIIREGVRELIRSGKLVSVSRTELCVPKAMAAYQQYLREDYTDTIRGIVAKSIDSEEFTVMDVVACWKMDQHLTTNAKRTLVRRTLPKIEFVKSVNDFEFKKAR